jgi:hypothetical protein
VTIYSSDWFTQSSLQSVPIAVTRRWWTRQLSGLKITGLSLHPAGDLVVVGTPDYSHSQNTVFGLRREGPFGPDGAGCATDGARWCYGGADSLGEVYGPAAIGADSSAGAQDATIYITSGAGRVVALDRDGAKRWAATLPSSVAGGPAVGTFDVDGLGAAELVFVAADDGTLSVLREDVATPGAAVVSSIQLADPVSYSAPLLSGGALFVSTTAAAQRVPVTTAGQLGTPVAYAESASSLGGIVDGGSGLLYAAGRRFPSPFVQQFTSATLERGWANDPVLASTATADPIVGADRVYVPIYAGSAQLLEIDTSTLATREVASPGWAPNGPLLGSDGLLYLALDYGHLLVVDPVTHLYSWSDDLDPSGWGRDSSASVMDCAGHLFVGSGDTVVAYITDARGMADAPWPRARRDSRGSGNAEALRAGIRAGGACAE